MNSLMRKRGLGALALAGTAGLLLAGCAAPPTTGTTASASTFRGCAVSDEGSWNDKSFNEAAHDGLLKAKKDLSIQTSDAESKTTEAFKPNLDQMIAAKCDVTFAVGFNLIDPVNAAAVANPKTNFVTIDGYVKEKTTTNLKAITYSMEQSSYLAGYLAAAYSTTKVVGTYGGLDIPAVTAFMDGFYYGAKAFEKESGKPVTVLGRNPMAKTGDFTDPKTSFGDTEGAKSISAGQLAKGADVIFPVAGGLFSSTAQAIKDSGKNAVFIGVDKNVALTSPQYADLVLTSVEKRMTQAVYDVIKDTKDNGFKSDAYVGTLKNDGTGLSEFGKFDSKVSADIKAKLVKLTAGIEDGSINPLS